MDLKNYFSRKWEYTAESYEGCDEEDMETTWYHDGTSSKLKLSNHLSSSNLEHVLKITIEGPGLRGCGL